MITIIKQPVIFWSEEQIWSSQCSFCQLILSIGEWTEVHHIVYNPRLFSILQTGSFENKPAERERHWSHQLHKNNGANQKGSKQLNGAAFLASQHDQIWILKEATTRIDCTDCTHGCVWNLFALYNNQQSSAFQHRQISLFKYITLSFPVRQCSHNQ